MTIASSSTGTIILVLAIYLLPTIIAFGRSTHNRWSVWVINVFLGWTLIGWVIALAMSAADVAPRPQR